MQDGTAAKTRRRGARPSDTVAQIRENDLPLHLKRRGLTVLVCAIVLVVLWGLSHWPGFVEVYARGVEASIARTLSLITGVVSFSVAEFVLAGVTIYLLAPLVTAAVQVRRRRRGLSNAIASGALRVLAFAALIASTFYLSWGLNYARAPLPARMEWPTLGPPADAAEHEHQTEEIGRITRQLVEATNANYREFAGSDDLGHPSVPPAGSPSLDATLDAAYARVQHRLGLEPAFGLARGRAKPLLASVLLSHLNLTGFYFPWTGEATYNRFEPAPSLPHTVAHEKAHQRGFAREDEASFIGYLGCAMSDAPYVRYSGYLFAQQQLLGELARRDAPAARQLRLGLRVKGVQRDIDAISLFWQQYEGAPSRLSATVNDAYLRSQGEKRGIAAYAASRSLIVLFARQNGGSAVLEPPAKQ